MKAAESLISASFVMGGDECFINVGLSELCNQCLVYSGQKKNVEDILHSLQCY